MATIVQTQNRAARLGEDIGLAFGEGMDAGFKAETEHRAQRQRSQLLGDLLDDVKRSPTRESAMTLLATPKYSGLFDSIEEVKGFGELVDRVHSGKGDDLEKVDITVGGKPRTSFIPKQDLKKIGNDDSLLSEYIGVKDASFNQPTKDAADEFMSIIDPKTGTVKTRVKTNDFNTDPNKYLQGGKYVTQKGFENAQSLAKERRLRESGSGEGGASDNLLTSNTAEIVAARGTLERRGMQLTESNVQQALAVNRRVNEFSPRLATAFNMQASEQGFIEKFEGSGDSERFAVAQTAMPDLMYAGLTDTQAFKAARKIGQAIPVKMRQPDGAGGFTEITRPPDITVEEVDIASSSFAEKAQKLDPRVDKGKIFKAGNTFYVYVGEKDGEPAFEAVEI